MPYKSIQTFKKLVTDYLVSVGAKPHPLPHLASRGYLVLGTRYGTLEIRDFADDAYQLFTVFQEPKRAAEVFCNPHTGKWNHYCLSTFTPSVAAQKVTDNLATVLPERTGRQRTLQLDL